MRASILRLAILAGLLAGPAFAATFVVTKTTDDDGACAVDDCALREAILAANALPGPDRVEIPSGTYQLSLTGPVSENAGVTGDLDILDALELEGVGGMATIVSDGTDRVLHFIGLHEFIVSNIVVTGGVTTSSGGGIRASGLITIRDVIVHDNESLGDAGGIFIVLNEGATITGTTVVNNRAPAGLGGGLRVFSSSSFESLSIVNSTFSGNDAFSGGGAYLYGGGQIELVNTTFADNTSDVAFSEALVGDGTVRLTFLNTLISNNNCGYISAIPQSNGHNMEGPTATCFVPGEGDAMGVPDVMLGPLAENGGPTPTHALLQGSPAIDAALDTDCPATDQRGVARPQDADADGSAVCDIGAFELLGPSSVLEIPTLGEVGRLAFVLLAALAGVVLLRQRCGS